MADVSVCDYYFMHRCWKIVKNRKRRRCWVKSLMEKREERGLYNSLVKELNTGDEAYFFTYFRVTKVQMVRLLELVGPTIGKKETNFRKPISAEQRLAVTLRYLATRESSASLHFGYRLGCSTVQKIVGECCNALWTALQPMYLPDPRSIDWMKVATEYEEKWQFPLCLGAIDGKHVAIQAPPNSGSDFLITNTTSEWFCWLLLIPIAHSLLSMWEVMEGKVTVEFSSEAILEEKY